MTIGLGGTGPYGAIRMLRREIHNAEYELRLVTEQKMRRKLGKKVLLKIIEDRKAQIKKILSSQKKKKSKGASSCRQRQKK